jgi:carboxymethylenebutenolidase
MNKFGAIKSPGHMDQRIIQLYDEYTHKPLTRKEFLERLIQLAGGTATAMALLPLLESCSTPAKTQSGDLFTEYATYPGVRLSENEERQ